MAYNVWRNHAAVFAAGNEVPGAAIKRLIVFAAKGTDQVAAKTVERPQLLLLTSHQTRLSTKGASWLRLLCAVAGAF